MIFRSLKRFAFLVALVSLLIYAHLSLDVSGQANPHLRRVNVPYFDDHVHFSETAIFWFGTLSADSNAADVRVGYRDQHLYLRIAVFDRRLWYKSNPSADDLTNWDAVTLYLSQNGNTDDVLDADTYRFDATLNWWEEPRDNYQAAYLGQGDEWVSVTLPFTTTSGWRGNAPNDNVDDRAWTLSYVIPFASLGLQAAPAPGSIWGMAIVLHDRDALEAAPLTDQSWPEIMSSQNPSSWGELVFDPSEEFTPPAAISETITIIREGLAGIIVPDAMVGGGTDCGNPAKPDYFSAWGELNYAHQEFFNVQNLADAGDWPCISKYYVTFPLDTLPADKVVISATLTLHHFGNCDPRQAQPSLIQALTVGEDWDEQTLTWNNAPLAQENIAATWVEPVTETPDWPGIPYHWDVSRSVAEAYASGIPLRLALYQSDWDYHGGKYFISADADDWNAAGRPTLTVAWGKPVADIVKTVAPSNGDYGNTVTYTLHLFGTEGSHTLTDTLPIGVTAPLSFKLAGTTVEPLYESSQHSFTWSDILTNGQEVTIQYPVTITTYYIQSLVNIAELRQADGEGNSDTAILLTNAYHNYLPLLLKGRHTEWPMAGANPQRTSWTSEEVRGALKPVWFRPIEPYIPPQVQIIAANGQLYISTARGLYALDAATGAEVWVYPTEMPLGHSPTVKDRVVYVGGLDHKLHAIDALTGESLWVFEATAGFQTNPLVVEGKVYVGNRDGYLYAIHAQGEPNAGQLAWKYKTAGPILFSAAYHAGTIYFASNDSYAYALDAQTGSLVWKSDQLPGAGFHSWWPVIQPETNVVVFAGSNNYRHYLPPAESTDLLGKERDDVYPARASDPRGTLFGGRNAAGLVDATRALQYFEEKPWRRTYFVLNKETGEEVTFDFDYDTVAEYAPILWHGTHSGNRYPPVVSVDRKLYQSNHYMSDEWIPGGQVSGWEVGSSKISTPSSLWKAMDEPLAYSGGGNLIYWNHCNDRSAGAFDVTIPNTQFYPSDADATREWVYFSYNLASLIPGYNDLYEGVNSTDYTINNLFRGPDHSLNGIYGQHGDQNAPIPYQGKIYMHRSNSIIAFGNDPGTPTALPLLETVAVQNADLTLATTTTLKNCLSQEIQKILTAGHLCPGYRSVGLFDIRTKEDYGDHLLDYWHQPTDVLYTLIMALPYLPENQQQQVKTYLQSEYQNFSPTQYTHIGWRDGTTRESSSFPQEVESDRENSIPKITGYSFAGWTWPPQMFYGLWKYAEVFGSAQEVFDTSSSKLESPPANEYLIEYPYVHNAYLAGYLGYLELEELAGYPESAAVRAEFNRLLNLRMSTFSKDTPFTDGEYHRALSVARNFIFLVPEIGEYMHAHILTKVQTAVAEYNEVAPYWFVANFEATHGEGVTQHYYDYQSLFQAQAWILEAPQEELIKYLDVPVVQVGDFFYIQNLVATIAASTQSESAIIATPSTVVQGAR
ncbi:MAG: PQQ-binding-like beta-propeller repeat protein [Anaerolineae bacterium]|nr:PQQ-binding-like beta-propeller repeat protein [Anaerolineae bacterium]